ncbi:MAG: GntR family transcriptional regulator [Spirochaetes bacterium]|nr:GntR family transcriptional regulator [Spirochaetota bacterium]
MSKIKPLYQTIIDHLKEDISLGKIRQGDQIPTEKELSLKYNVSRITVIRAIKELEYSGVVERIKGKGTFIKKEITSLTDFIQSDKEHLKIISIIMPINSDTSLELISGIEEACQANGYALSIHNSVHNSFEEERILYELDKKKIEGILLYPYYQNENIGIISSLLIQKIPLVFIDRRINGVRLPCIGSDNYQGCRNITNYLFGLGHKNIAFVSLSERYVETEEDRLSGYCQAHIDNEIEINKAYIYTRYGSKVNDLNNQAEIALESLLSLSEPPTAIVSVCDVVALGLINKAKKRGLSIPDDLSIVGFDDILFAEHSDPPLTTVKQPRREIGKAAIKVLFDMKKGKMKSVPQNIHLETELVIRESVKKL